MTKTRIMVVEDEVVVGMELRATLRRDGYEVTSLATSGEEALAAVERQRPDLVVMDIVLGGRITGIEAARAIKERWGIPVVFISAHADDGVLEQAKKAEPFGYLIKPFHEREFRTTIEVALNKARGETRDIISERRRSEEALRSSQEWSQAIIATAMDGFMLSDPRGRILAVNQAYCDMSGYAEAELLTMRVRDLEADMTPRELAARGGALMEAGTDRFETRHRRKNGDVMVVEISAQYRDKHQGEFVMFLRDVTPRKMAEETLAEREEMFHSLFNSITELAVLHDLVLDQAGRPVDYRVLDCNVAFTKVTGIPREAALGALASQLYGTGQAPFLAIYARTALTGEPARFSAYFEPMGKHFDITAIGISKRRFATIAQDVTTQIAADQRKAQLEAQLRQAQKMEAIGTLAGGIAHDFNNILSSILGFADLARHELPDDHPVRPDLDDVVKGCLRARELVRQILTFSRASEQERQALYLAPLVKEALKLVRSTTPSTIGIQQAIGADQAMVMAESTHMHQLVMNLAANAVHAMKAEGGTLAVTLEEAEILAHEPARRAGLPAGRYLCLSVSDTGHGMAPEVLGRIFDPFFTTKKVGEGTGMGLSVAHGIVKEMGGGIEVASHPGQGTTFRVWLPRWTQGRPQAPSLDKPPARGRHRVLLVDDEPAILIAQSRILGNLGHTVATAESGQQALGILRDTAHGFDLLISDQTMPGMTGLELAKRARDIAPAMPVILCTGYSELITEESLREAGLDTVLNKPITARELSEAMKRMLDALDGD